MTQRSDWEKLKYTFRRLMKLGSQGAAQGEAFYNTMYDTEGEYRRDFRDSMYLAVWSQVYRLLRQIPQAKVLEVGCGAGQFAGFLNFLGFGNYVKGFDLSSQAVEIARTRAPFNFIQANACDPEAYQGDYNTVISLETLEHIPDDFAALKNFPPGAFLIASLPDFEYESHYRWFTNARQIEKRYYRYIDIQEIVKVESWHVVFGKVDPVAPSFLQRVFKTRSRVNTIFLWNRYIKSTLKILIKPVIRAVFSR
ncbi:MAG: methyltransferase domain-containing protein [Phycisphaerae bacterium]